LESLNLLKQEISQTLESEHDFAKWLLASRNNLADRNCGNLHNMGQSSTPPK